MADVCGAVIDQGVSDWQVFQGDTVGGADIAVAGRWGGAQGATVELRLVHEDTAVPVAMHLDWQPAETRPDGTWSGVLKAAPAGGLYRLETHLRTNANEPVEWAPRGDMRHFLGVGDLWIIAGQSNSAGYGRGPCFDPPELGVHLFNNAMRWTLASQPLNESTDTAHSANREGGNSGHGPWLHFARLIKQQTNVPVGLVQVSLGGSPLSAWNPTEPGEHPLYDLMIRVHAAVGGRVRGVLWYQGCSDANPQQAPTYEERFVAAVAAWRRATKQPDLPVLTVQISHWTGTGAGTDDSAADLPWTLLRDAQRRVPQRMQNVTVSPTLDLALTDGIHISPFGNLLLAQRVAQAALATVYGRSVHYRAPQPASAKAQQGGTVIEIEFADVVGRMATIDPMSIPFRVEDAEGIVVLSSVEYTSAAIIRLHLKRVLAGKAVVHGAYGYNPPPVPMDMDRAMPMLGFYAFPVEK